MCYPPSSRLLHHSPPGSSHRVCEPTWNAEQAQNRTLSSESELHPHLDNPGPVRASKEPFWESTSHLLRFPSQHHNLLMPQSTQGWAFLLLLPLFLLLLLLPHAEALHVPIARCTLHEVPSTLAQRVYSIMTKRTGLRDRLDLRQDSKKLGKFMGKWKGETETRKLNKTEQFELLQPAG